MTRKITIFFSVIAILLGVLWLSQGLGLVHLRPILCFADCVPIKGPSGTWAAVGAVMLAVGGYGIFWARKQVTK